MVAKITNQGSSWPTECNSHCKKANHFQQVCRSLAKDTKQERQKGKPNPAHEACQRMDESWEGSDEEIEL